MKHAAMLASKPDLDMEEAKRVHTSLRKASGKVLCKKKLPKFGRKFYLIKSCPIWFKLFGQGIW